MGLNASQRENVRSTLMSFWSNDRLSTSLTKADLASAVAAVDDWVDANVESFNAALPLPARSVLSASAKTQLLSLVLHARFGAGF